MMLVANCFTHQPERENSRSNQVHAQNIPNCLLFTAYARFREWPYAEPRLPRHLRASCAHAPTWAGVLLGWTVLPCHADRSRQSEGPAKKHRRVIVSKTYKTCHLCGCVNWFWKLVLNAMQLLSMTSMRQQPYYNQHPVQTACPSSLYRLHANSRARAHTHSHPPHDAMHFRSTFNKNGMFADSTIPFCHFLPCFLHPPLFIPFPAALNGELVPCFFFFLSFNHGKFSVTRSVPPQL